MAYQLPEFKAPDISEVLFVNASNAAFVKIVKEGVAPDGYHAMSIFPEYSKNEVK